MSGDHDTTSLGNRPSGEPSQPTAPKVGGAATPPVRSAPPGPWLPTDNFVYGLRYHLEHWDGCGLVREYDEVRERSLRNRIAHQYGNKRAESVVCGQDAAMNADVAAWKRLGS
jgi:hypothetical protein